jgi:hypothetical protein
MNEAWRNQKTEMVEALLAWEASGREAPLEEDGGLGLHPALPVYYFHRKSSTCASAERSNDMYKGRTAVSLALQEDEAFTVSLVKAGIMPCTPMHPELGIAIEVLELFRVLTSRCPQVSIQVFVKTLATQSAVSTPYIQLCFLTCVFRSATEQLTASSSVTRFTRT